MVGRIVRDYASGAVIREHALLHPCDGLFSIAAPLEFLKTTPAPVTFYGALAWEKNQREEAVSPRVYSQVEVYMAAYEAGSRGFLVKSPQGAYYRVQGETLSTGGLRRLACSELGASAVASVTYTPIGTYTPATDTFGTLTPVVVKTLTERYQVGYHYLARAATPYEVGDTVITVAKTAIVLPKPGDTVPGFRVIGVQDDGLSCWALHARPQ
jgi:hypothetical protein